MPHTQEEGEEQEGRFGLARCAIRTFLSMPSSVERLRIIGHSLEEQREGGVGVRVEAGVVGGTRTAVVEGAGTKVGAGAAGAVPAPPFMLLKCALRDFCEMFFLLFYFAFSVAPLLINDATCDMSAAPAFASPSAYASSIPHPPFAFTSAYPAYRSCSRVPFLSVSLVLMSIICVKVGRKLFSWFAALLNGASFICEACHMAGGVWQGSPLSSLYTPRFLLDPLDKASSSSEKWRHDAQIET